MSKPPKHSKSSIKANPPPNREDYPSGEAYAEACKKTHDARIAANTSASPKESKRAKPALDSSKNKQTPEKQLTAAEKLDEVGIEVIGDRIAEGHFYEDIAKDCGVARGTLKKWLDGNHAAAYAHAREARAHKLAEEILRISDDSTRDTYIDENGVERTDHEVVARSRLRVDSRKWLASKMLPSAYGDKIDMNHGVQPNNPLADFLAKISGTALPIKE